jgi:hypothetical protein
VEARARRRADSLAQVLAFVTAHRAVFESTSFGTKMVAALQHVADKVSSLFTAFATGTSASRDAAVERARARVSVLKTARAIRRAGRLLSIVGAATEERFPRLLPMSDRQLLSEARSIDANAQPLADAFVTHGLPPTVLQNFSAQIDGLESLMETQGTAIDTHVAAKKAAVEALAESREIIAALESILLNAPGVDAFTIEVWNSAKRIGPGRAAAPAAGSASGAGAGEADASASQPGLGAGGLGGYDRGTWGAGTALRLAVPSNPLLERLVQRKEQPSDRGEVRVQRAADLLGQKTEARRHLDAGFEFGMRAEGDADVICVGRLAPTVTLRDIRRNRNGGAT